MRARGLLLDRDGVVNQDHGYVGTRDRFAFVPGAVEGLRWAQDAGWRLAIVTNQSGIARGYFTEQDYDDLTAFMRAQLAEAGIALDLVLACFRHPEAVRDAYRGTSYWCKPNPGMVLEAVQRLNLDPARSAMVGDGIRDMEAAHRGGLGTCILMGGPAPLAVPPYVRAVPDWTGVRAALA